MCTVIVEVPEKAGAPIRLLAVRDELPERPWDGPGAWWPERPGVIGVRDRVANGAWLAAAPAAGKLAVLVNRDAEVAEPNGGFASRGAIVLDAVASTPVADQPHTQAFTLVEVANGAVHTVAWNGMEVRRERLSPGVHMLAHHELDDPTTPRIACWLPEFQALAGVDGWRERWIATLAHSAELSNGDDRAIIRDNRVHGYPTQSLLVCQAEISRNSVELAWAPLAAPGAWDAPTLTDV